MAVRRGVARARTRIQRASVCSPVMEELRDEVEEALGLLPEEQMPGSAEELQTRAWDSLGQQRRVARVDDAVGRPVQDERRRADGRDAVEGVEARARGGLRLPAG